MSDAPDLAPVYTIGYGGRSLDELSAMLRQHEIDCLVDVRTSPHSSFQPEFNRASLEASLPARGIRYVFLGDALGGRPDDPECYTDGKADYDRIRAKPFFERGLARVFRAREQGMRLALLCSERKPEECHRSKLIGVALGGLGVPVAHLDENGDLVPQDQVIARLTAGQLSLFGDPSFTSRKRYQDSG